MAGNNDLLKEFVLNGRLKLPPAPKSPLIDFFGLPPLPPKPKGVPLKIIPLPPKNRSELISRIQTQTRSLLNMNVQLVKARKVPAVSEVANNEAKIITTSVLHVDMRKSSQILENHDAVTALRIYKIFHAALVAVARYRKGRIRTFAGDRIGVVFDLHEERQRSIAVETAQMMEDVLQNSINPLIENTIGYSFDFGIGVDYGQMFVGKVGQTGADNNDLVWTGVAMNRASKLADYGSGVFVSQNVFDFMAPNLKNDDCIWIPSKNVDLGTIYQWAGRL